MKNMISIKCVMCEGEGSTSKTVYYTCIMCNGKGEIWDEIKGQGKWCNYCGGNGFDKKVIDIECKWCKGEGVRSWTDIIVRPFPKTTRIDNDRDKRKSMDTSSDKNKRTRKRISK